MTGVFGVSAKPANQQLISNRAIFQAGAAPSCPENVTGVGHNSKTAGFVTQAKVHTSPPWPSGYKRRNPTLVPVVRARFEPRCGRPHFAPTRSGVRVSVAGTAQRPESVSGRRGPCPVYRAR